MKKSTKWVVLALALMGAAGGFFYYKVTRSNNPLADVITTRVKRGDIEVGVMATGEIRPSRLVAVGAQASGRVTKLHVKLGQTVAKGDLIAEIDSLTQENALKTAEAALAATQAQRDEKEASLTYAKAALERSRQGLGNRATSQDAFETAETTVKTTLAQIANLDAQIAEARVAVQTANVDLGYTRITAPMAGAVLLIVTQEGQTVNATQSAPTIVVLGKIDEMMVQAEISEADVINVKPGQEVYFTILGDVGRRWDAKLASVDPAPDSLRTDSEITSSSSSSSSSSSTSEAIYYYGRFNIPNPDGLLRTYMTAEVHVVLGRVKNVLTAPASAVHAPAQPGGKPWIEVVAADKTISKREVETGLTDKIMTEIKTGLEEGDTIVSSRRSASAAASTDAGPPPMGM